MRSPIFVGHGERYEQVVDYLAPHHDQVPAMLEGLRAFAQRTAPAPVREDAARHEGRNWVPSVLRATVLSFGFVYIHPMADGNGRISRFLINDTLRRDGALPKPLILPESAHEQSVRYVSECALSMPLDEFQSGVDEFISAVVRRLAAVGHGGSELAQLWGLIQADRQDPEATRYRRIEAALGYDPDECPQGLIEQALAYDQAMGGSALAELAPLYGKFGSEPSLAALDELREQPGLVGKPAVPDLHLARPKSAAEPPWVRAVSAARALRETIGVGEGKVGNETLQELLGLQRVDTMEQPEAGVKRRSGVGVPQSAGQIKFMPRKRHPVSRRFELSRFIADLVQTQGTPQWLTSTDLSTSRQKFQRAFAAEFLCPIDELTSFLDGDYSESGIEDAAEYYDVSEHTVASLLANHGLIQPPWARGYGEVTLPYALGI